MTRTVPARWNPLRVEVERILADGIWHEAEPLFHQVERFVDPRIAARSWARQYNLNQARKLARGSAEEVEPSSRVMVRDQPHVMEVGRWRVFWACIRSMRALGHVETQLWSGRRRVRLVRGGP